MAVVAPVNRRLSTISAFLGCHLNEVTSIAHLKRIDLEVAGFFDPGSSFSQEVIARFYELRRIPIDGSEVVQNALFSKRSELREDAIRTVYNRVYDKIVRAPARSAPPASPRPANVMPSYAYQEPVRTGGFHVDALIRGSLTHRRK